ncbi:MAG: hypothetical protein V9G14_06940 [Cypionkella sp.]
MPRPTAQSPTAQTGCLWSWRLPWSFWSVAVKFWGLIALTFAATAMVPVIFILFIIISWPF